MQEVEVFGLHLRSTMTLHACDIRESWVGQQGRASQAARSEVKEEDQRLCSLSSYRCAEGVLKVRFSMLRFTGGVRGRMSCAIACTLSTPARLLLNDAEQRPASIIKAVSV